MERTLWAAMKGAARGRHRRPPRRRAGADVLQLGHPAGVQHRRRGRRRSSTSMPSRAAARRRARAAAVRQRARRRGLTRRSSDRILERIPVVGAVCRHSSAMRPSVARSHRRRARRDGAARVRSSSTWCARCSTATRARTSSAGCGAATVTLAAGAPAAPRGARHRGGCRAARRQNEVSVVFGFSWSYFRVEVAAAARAGGLPQLDHAAQAGRRAVQRASATTSTARPSCSGT